MRPLPSLRRILRTRPTPASNGEAILPGGYVDSAPSPQVALDIFSGEWASALPGELARFRAGSIPLFADDRIDWLVAELGGVAGMNILELGPLEAGHTYMLERHGARRVIAVEGNRRAFLKCLVIKELFKLNRSEFLCGDLISFLEHNEEFFDICVASGVLYHMRDPLALLTLLGRTAPAVFLWTHYYDERVISSNSRLAERFTGHRHVEAAEAMYTLHRYDYGSALASPAFCGGSADFSEWLERDTILTELSQAGFTQLNIGFDDPEHVNGPSFAVLATR